jgi:dienelactone hydrolase
MISHRFVLHSRLPGVLLLIFVTTSIFAAPQERELNITSAGARIAGTLVLPEKKTLAAIVLVPWAGKVERALPLARKFANHGIAVYTYDKRGVGQSEGEYGVGSFQQQLETLGADAAAALSALNGRPELKGVTSGFFGISQAGWVIPYAANRSRPAFIALWSGPVCTVQEELHFSAVAENDATYLERHTPAQIRDYMKKTPRHRDDVDPVPYLREITVPGLWIFGGKDNSIPVDLSIERLTTLISSGRSNFEYKLYPAQGHSLTNEDREGFVHVVQWIVSHAGGIRSLRDFARAVNCPARLVHEAGRLFCARLTFASILSSSVRTLSGKRNLQSAHPVSGLPWCRTPSGRPDKCGFGHSHRLPG